MEVSPARKVALTRLKASPAEDIQWQKNGMDIAGATGPTCTIKQAITADSGATFRVVASNAEGSNASIPAVLTVIPAPGAPVVVANPARARLHPGETATFSVSVKSQTPMSYQWQQGRLTTNFTDIPVPRRSRTRRPRQECPTTAPSFGALSRTPPGRRSVPAR